METNKFKFDKKALGIFITAGFPELNSTTEQILFLQESGIDFIEIGIPFSDPMADGPIIQMSSEIALKNGMTLELMFNQIESIKDQIKIPIVLMGYLNPVLKFGIEKILKRAEMCKIAGLIIPDLNYEIMVSKFSDEFSNSEIPLINLITPETSDQRILKIAEISKNSFIYLVSSNSITGVNFNFKKRENRYLEIKKLCQNTPVFIGFGIKTIEDINYLNDFSDGCIIGSEYIKQVQQNRKEIYIQKLLNIGLSL